jgi:serine protease
MNPKLVRVLGCVLAAIMAVVAVAWPASAAVVTPNDPHYPRQWFLRRIGTPTAWSVTQGQGITVAVIDTGIRAEHADLKANLVKGYDFLQDDPDPTDPQGHGTAVSGIVAAVTNNKQGVAGVAPKAKVMPLRACSNVGENTCDSQAVADAIMWATDHGADVINMSLGGLLPTPATQAAVLYATAGGVLVVASAGNETLPTCGWPAANPASICVGASDGLDKLATFSNYGVRADVVAPGVGLWTTALVGYSSFDGTSAAAPVVAGAGALLMSMGATNVQAAQIIRLTAKDLGLPGYDITYGFGRLDAKSAVELCQQIC